MPEFENMVQDWVAVATQHGANFTNVEFPSQDGNVFVSAIDPDQDCHIYIPEAFLVPAEAIEVTEESAQISPDHPLPDQLRLMFNKFLNFVLSDERVDRLRSLHEGIQKFPEDLYRELEAKRCIPQFIPGVPNQKGDFKKRLLRSRTLVLPKRGRVLIPLLDFANHHPSGALFANADGGIEIKGRASDSGEFFASYSSADPLQILNLYAFSGESNFAYSLPVQIKFTNGLILNVGRRHSDTDKSKEGLNMPRCEVEGSTVSISYVMLGCVRNPRRPYWSFFKAWEASGLEDPITVYSSILRHNWRSLVGLQRLAAGVEGEAAALLRATLFKQMSVMAENQIETSGGQLGPGSGLQAHSS